jgi:hypothetical protein
VNEFGRRLRALPAADAVALAGLGMVLVGVAATVEALVEAARATPSASLLAWYDRLALGLWEFRIEHTLWFTAGLLALWWALSHGAILAGWSGYAGRLAGGLAIGYALVGAAMALASTIVALRGGIGSGVAEVTFSTRERVLVWLLQVVTGLGAGLVWALVAARVPDEPVVVAAREEEPVADLDESVEPAPAPGRRPAAPSPPSLEPQPRPATVDPTAVADLAARADPPSPRSLIEQAHLIFQERLAYSPRREEARTLLDRIAQADRAGRSDEARDLVEQLSRL